jgi:FKBP-type peptidyl-prolyl cis-trans isomerase (trigger factor)
MRQTTQEQFLEEEAKPVAIKRFERSLILDQLAREEKIEVDETALQDEFGQTLNELQYQGMDLGKVRGGKRGQQQVAEAIAMQSANRLMTRRTLERIKAIATGEYKPEEAEGEEKPKKASASKKSSKTVEEKSADATKAKKSTSAKSSKTKSTTKKAATKKPKSE